MLPVASSRCSVQANTSRRSRKCPTGVAVISGARTRPALVGTPGLALRSASVPVVVTECAQPGTQPDSVAGVRNEPASSGDRHPEIGWKQLVVDDRVLGVREALQVLIVGEAEVDQSSARVELVPDRRDECAQARPKRTPRRVKGG